MTWTDQDPPADNVIMQGVVYINNDRDEAHFEIDKIGDRYRYTIGNLFGSTDVGQDTDLERLITTVSKKLPRMKWGRRAT